MTSENQSSPHLTLTEAAALCPGRPHASALWRWCRNGLVCRNGTRVKLHHIGVGRKIFTTQEWLDQFFADKATADVAAFEQNRAPTHRELELAERQREAELTTEHTESMEYLESLGMK